MAHLYFFPTHRPTQKNPKEPPSQRTKTQQIMDNRATTDRTPAPNSGLAKVAVQCSADTFVVTESSVLRINICGENHHLRQAAKRYRQW
ncbi:MAG: hypothetical protein IPM34_14910 [Saprospiraceae bacterium]|nr:hypothetical protein [Saprospiraceae bacterium]